MEQLSATRTRHGSVGLDGAESYYCDLSGRGLATAQIERTLRVFETAEAIDLSNNEIERIPSTIPPSILALDMSFNLIASAEGIDRLKNLQELHLGFNRLMDVSMLEFCPRLQRVNLSGNRLMNTKGLETLVLLEHLDLSENLIEFPEALRALSLNQNLTHLTLRGNPIGLNPKSDYRVLLLDMIPSVLVLDDKKIRSAVKFKSAESGGGAAASKSLSYSRLYDDKKQFVIRNQNRPYPAKKVKPLVAGDTTSRYDATMFLQPAVEPSYERVRSLQLQEVHSESLVAPEPLTHSRGTPPPAPFAASASGAKPSAAPYMSLYDRLAQANSMQQLTKSATPPSKPIETRPSVNSVANSGAAAVLADKSKRHEAAAAAVPVPMPITAVGKSRAALMSPAQSALRGSVHRAAAPVRSIPTVATPASASSKKPSTPAVRTTSDPRLNASVRGKQPAAPPNTNRAPALDEKQRNVLNVIQNLIQHKKQTLATLSRASPVAT